MLSSVHYIAILHETHNSNSQDDVKIERGVIVISVVRHLIVLGELQQTHSVFFRGHARIEL